MTRAARIAALLLVACHGVAGAADKRGRTEADDARWTMRVYLECIVKEARRGAAHARLVTFLSRPANDREGNKAAAALTQPDCLKGAATAFTYVSKLNFQASLLRGEAFRALYLAEPVRPGRAILQPSEIAAGWSTAPEDPATPLRNFGDCVVAIDRTQADAAIRADVASAAETAAYRALGPAFARCVTPDSTLRFSRAVLEGALSEGLYRQAKGVVPAAPATEPR